jgi:hypothetical protein
MGYKIVGLQITPGEPCYVFVPEFGKIDLNKITEAQARKLIEKKSKYLIEDKAPINESKTK